MMKGERSLTMEQMESNKKVMHLVKKSKKGLSRIVFSRLGLIILLLAVQVGVIVLILSWFGEYAAHFYGLIFLFSLVMGLGMINSKSDPTSKMTWLYLMSVTPILGALFYWFVKSDLGHRTLKNKVNSIIDRTEDTAQQDPETLALLKQKNPGAASLAHYAKQHNGYPVWDETEITYFPLGEDKWKEMLKQLEEAKDFIFMEYFIIEEGLMWGSILDILARKAKEGVDVRVMYDGTCAFTTLPYSYPERMRELGIKCKMFSPVLPFISTTYNYRDHRKILVIDGQVAFNGGVNLADEYINHIEKHGHWKDVAVMVKGKAVQTFTLMFLQMWNAEEAKEDFGSYLEVVPEPVKEAKGFVMPYGFNPLDDDRIGENVYIDILNRAQEYVHIMTPYLILDGEMEAALKLCAQRGVDVKIIMPGVPDKFVPYAMAKNHYKDLIEGGVQIYEYTPGFVHAKVFVADDREAVVGTINLDYRSLYHHFECATYMYDVPAVAQVEDDFEETLKKCSLVTLEKAKSRSLKYKVTGWIMKIFAPLF